MSMEAALDIATIGPSLSFPDGRRTHPAIYLAGADLMAERSPAAECPASRDLIASGHQESPGRTLSPKAL